MQQHENGQDGKDGPLRRENSGISWGNRVISSRSTYLNFGIFVHEDRDDAHIGQEAPGPAHNVLFGQPQLVGRVQTPVVHVVIVTLGQELDGTILPVERSGDY